MKKKQLIKYIVDHVHTYIYIYIITVREGNNIHNLGKGKIVVLLFISILLFCFLVSSIHSCKYVRGLSNISGGGNRIKICKGGKFTPNEYHGYFFCLFLVLVSRKKKE